MVAASLFLIYDMSRPNLQIPSSASSLRRILEPVAVFWVVERKEDVENQCEISSHQDRKAPNYHLRRQEALLGGKMRARIRKDG